MSSYPLLQARGASRLARKNQVLNILSHLSGRFRNKVSWGDISVAHALAFAALGLQAQAGCPVTFSRVTQTTERCIFQVVVEYSEEEVGRLAMALAERLCRAALDEAPFDLADALSRVHELDEDVRQRNQRGVRQRKLASDSWWKSNTGKE